MKSKKIETVRVRFAPSPTGHLHIGSLRSALFNWLFARHTSGQFLLRIEDTDSERSKDEYTTGLLDSLAWCGLIADEPILIQSSRKQEHQRIAQQMVEKGTAYRCYCTPDELDERLGKNSQGVGEYRKYDQHCFNCQQRGEQSLAEMADKPYVIRFHIPDTAQEQNAGLLFHDIIRGPVHFNADQFDDFVLIRSDGMPMYNFAVVVDDAHMDITHVIRGEDHLINTPKQIWLYQALGYSVPQFAHIPLILGPSGQKLSKRDGAVSVGDYQAKGYLAQALCNYLVRLGWSHGDQEIFTPEEMIASFSLDAVGKKGAIFDIEKLNWVNSVYIKASSAENIIDLCAKDIGISCIQRYPLWTANRINKAVALVKDRCNTLLQILEEIDSLYNKPQYAREQICTLWQDYSLQALCMQKIIALEFDQEENKEVYQKAIKAVMVECNTTMRTLAPLLRYALLAKTDSIGIFDCIEIIGWQECQARLTLFIEEIIKCQ